MRRTRVLTTKEELVAEFSRCCTEFDSLSLAVAWCGDPKQTLPYDKIKSFKGRVTAVIGVSFFHTHPDAIDWFIHLGADVRIFQDANEMFHPKVYLFTRCGAYALFVGSSNLTYGGFYSNIEVNTLIEGEFVAGRATDIRRLQHRLSEWHARSLRPTPKWLAEYTTTYRKNSAEARRGHVRLPPLFEQQMGRACWLRSADWSIYYAKVVEGLNSHTEKGEGYHRLLDRAAVALPVPWDEYYFEDIEKRRIMGGMHPHYADLGNVSASGRVRQLLKNGTKSEHRAIVSAVNAIANMRQPVDWDELKGHLTKLVSLGPTMRVWGRFLCLVRPDLYCTVASPSVRRNMSTTLSVPLNRFDSPDGYIQLIQLIHASPWFNSQKPSDTRARRIWKRRCALLDGVFYYATVQ